MILNNATHAGQTILQPESVDLIFYNFSTAFSEDVHGVVQTARRC